MKNVQRSTSGALLVLALVTSIATGHVLLTPLPACAGCGDCEDECTGGCCSAQGICAQCTQYGCCVYDGDPCEGGQLIYCHWC
jgi:hypothetical protein